jgi:hypothetical protein
MASTASEFEIVHPKANIECSGCFILTWNEQNEPAEPLVHVGAENSAQVPLVMTNSVEDLISTSCATGEIDPENTVRSMRKRATDRIVDKSNLNSCLCGSVVDPSMLGGKPTSRR